MKCKILFFFLNLLVQKNPSKERSKKWGDELGVLVAQSIQFCLPGLVHRKAIFPSFLCIQDGTMSNETWAEVIYGLFRQGNKMYCGTIQACSLLLGYNQKCLNYFFEESWSGELPSWPWSLPEKEWNPFCCAIEMLGLPAVANYHDKLF